MANPYVQLETHCADEAPRQRKHVWALCGILGAAVVLVLCSLGSGSASSASDLLGVVPVGLQRAGPHAGFVPDGRNSRLSAQHRPPQLIWGNMHQPHSTFARQTSTVAWNSPRLAVRGAQTAAAVTEVHSDEEFDAISAESENLVVLNIGTSWCVPCKMFMPTYISLAEEEEFGKVKFLKISGDENEKTVKLMKRLGVRSVPVFAFFKNGEEIGDRVVGAKEEDVRNAVTKLMQ
eukprot:gnl/TRDRNA2_/TRDRNA2_181631_c0_seq1.p1 gnl/TRDRNA2_/TRDRNA2_181631_c0~~gnl/TRDRNA2_/TRDRNA2_181631_c0_seq1.p1  ORF type:complete len:234 (+),score=27.53 gnl/TRDRNA2_/TRDRNA2_181631_c0_seq1:87-788(+)